MRRNAKIVPLAMLFAIAACGGADKGGNKVEMKDMEVVDGTATDAMTDLDGCPAERQCGRQCEYCYCQARRRKTAR
jgi:hypothetical protein